MTEPEITVVGGGAIGGTVTALLHRAGRRVRLVDSDRAHVDAIRHHGLRIDGLDAPVCEPVDACLPHEVSERGLTAVYLCTKVKDNAVAAPWVRDRLAPDGYVVSLQNGIHQADLAAAVGRGRVVGGLVNFFADVVAPGTIAFGGPGTIAVGELDGTAAARLQDIRDALGVLAEVVVTDNILGYAWSKMAYGVILATTAVTDATMEECVLSPYRGVFLRVAREVLNVADAIGVRPMAFDGWDPVAARRTDAANAVMEGIAAFLRTHDKVRSGVWRDLAVRHRKTEVQAQFRPIVALGARHSVATPTLSRLLEFVGELEEGRRERGWHNLDELDAVPLAGTPTSG